MKSEEAGVRLKKTQSLGVIITSRVILVSNLTPVNIAYPFHINKVSCEMRFSFDPLGTYRLCNRRYSTNEYYYTLIFLLGDMQRVPMVGR